VATVFHNYPLWREVDFLLPLESIGHHEDLHI
jgi:hypothetical protein